MLAPVILSDRDTMGACAVASPTNSHGATFSTDADEGCGMATARSGERKRQGRRRRAFGRVRVSLSNQESRLGWSTGGDR